MLSKNRREHVWCKITKFKISTTLSPCTLRPKLIFKIKCATILPKKIKNLYLLINFTRQFQVSF